MYGAGNLLLGLAAALLTSQRPPVYLVELTVVMAVQALFSVVFVSPAWETFALLGPTVLAAKVTRRRWLVCVIGAAPIVLLHFVVGWPKVVAVAWGFAWSAWCYLVLAEQGVSFRVRYAFLFGLHALGNGLALCFLAAGMSVP